MVFYIKKSVYMSLSSGNFIIQVVTIQVRHSLVMLRIFNSFRTFYEKLQTGCL